MGRSIPALLMLALLLPLACAHAPRDGDSPESSLDRIRARGVIRVGVSEFEPWAMRDKRGKLIGFEIDVADALAKDIGVRLESVPLPFEKLILELRAGHIDLIASGLSITPSRALEVAYSAPYRFSEITILASRERAGGRSDLAQFDEPETTIVAIRGTTGDMTARWALASAKLTSVHNQDEALAAVLEGRAHAAVATDPFPQLEALRSPKRLYLPLGSPLARTAEAFAVRQGDRDLLGWLNSWIMSRRTSRWLERRQIYWFHSLLWGSRI